MRVQRARDGGMPGTRGRSVRERPNESRTISNQGLAGTMNTLRRNDDQRRQRNHAHQSERSRLEHRLQVQLLSQSTRAVRSRLAVRIYNAFMEFGTNPLQENTFTQDDNDPAYDVCFGMVSTTVDDPRP